MSRPLASNAEITRMIQDRIRESKELNGDCRDVKVESVRWHEPDETGCNWNWSAYNGPPPCYAVVGAIVSDLRRRYNLRDA
jgi:hypothetical protein